MPEKCPRESGLVWSGLVLHDTKEGVLWGGSDQRGFGFPRVSFRLFLPLGARVDDYVILDKPLHSRGWLVALANYRFRRNICTERLVTHGGSRRPFSRDRPRVSHPEECHTRAVRGPSALEWFVQLHAFALPEPWTKIHLIQKHAIQWLWSRMM